MVADAAGRLTAFVIAWVVVAFVGGFLMLGMATKECSSHPGQFLAVGGVALAGLFAGWKMVSAWRPPFLILFPWRSSLLPRSAS